MVSYTHTRYDADLSALLQKKNTIACIGQFGKVCDAIVGLLYARQYVDNGYC